MDVRPSLSIAGSAPAHPLGFGLLAYGLLVLLVSGLTGKFYFRLGFSRTRIDRETDPSGFRRLMALHAAIAAVGAAMLYFGR